MEATNKTERFADYINKMSFSEVISFYNSLMQSIREKDGYDDWSAMYDYTIQEDARWMLDDLGVDEFLKGLSNPTVEERAYLIDVPEHYDRFCNPWTETLEHADEFIKFIENTTPEYYAEARAMIARTKKFKVAIIASITRVVEVEASDWREACDKCEEGLNDNGNYVKLSPFYRNDSIDYSFEVQND